MQLDLNIEIEERNSQFKKPSNLEQMYTKVTIASKREDIENSIRIKLDSLETIFAEIVTLPTNKYGFEKVILTRLHLIFF